ncbi:MAG: hypothetical protein WCD02_03855 [Terriglobales bacterium]
MRATISPGTVRSFSPAPNSDANISDKAVDTHAVSERSERFLKPRTATERRAWF